MNKLPCENCRHFDQKYRMASGKLIALPYGWCAAQSVYPADARAPEGAKLASAGAMAKPVIVKKLDVVSACIQVQAK